MDRVEAHRIVEQLITSFAWEVDRSGGRNIGALFAENARLVLPSPPTWTETVIFSGRQNIANRWVSRPADRVTRHVHLNIDVTDAAPTRIVCRSVGIGYRHDGADFGLPSAVIVADYDDICIFEDGAWKFEERKVTPVFVSPLLS